MRPSGVRFAALRKADAICLEEVARAGLYDAIWQAFAVLLPVKTVGMTADYYPFPHEFLGQVATRIINEVRGINRVVCDVTSKPPGTIEWEQAGWAGYRFQPVRTSIPDLGVPPANAGDLQAIGSRSRGKRTRRGPGIRKRLHHENEQNRNSIQRQCREMQVASECPALGCGTIGWGIAPRYPTSHRPARRRAAFF